MYRLINVLSDNRLSSVIANVWLYGHVTVSEETILHDARISIRITVNIHGFSKAEKSHVQTREGTFCKCA